MVQFIYPPVVLDKTGLATSANQASEIALLTSIDSHTTSMDTKLSSQATAANQTSEIAFLNTINSSASAINTKLTSQATAANQTTANASLSSIDSKLTAPLAVTGPLTDVQLRANAVPVSVTTLPLPAGAATETTLSALNSKVVAVNTGAVVVASSALPAGASTSANQTTQNSTLSTISTKLQTLIDEGNLKTVEVSALKNAATTNITIVPVTVIGSTAAQTLKIQTIDDIGEYMALYTGAALSEIILAAIPLGGGEVSVDVPAGTRISIGSLTGASITSGKIIINLLGV